MSTYTSTGTIAMTSSATLNAWIEEFCNAIFTECGLTQTSDTGQCWTPNTATATLSGSDNTSCGYVIGAFNDALQTDYPVYIRFDFCTGAASTDPQVWITVGTDSNGSGTITGTVMTKVGIGTNGAVNSTVTNYNSYYCYNSTLGTLFVGFKYGGSSGDTWTAYMGFYMFRGSTSDGASNGDAVMLLSPGIVTTGDEALAAQYLSFGKSTVYPTTLAAGSFCFLGCTGFTNNSSMGGNGPYIMPAAYFNPAPNLSAVCGVVNNSDVNVSSSFSATILGSSPITFLNAGGFCNQEIGGGDQNGMEGAEASASSLNSSASWGLAVVWE